MIKADKILWMDFVLKKVAKNPDEIGIKFLVDNGKFNEKKMKWQEDIDSVIFDVES